jgi:hypothetical protein
MLPLGQVLAQYIQLVLEEGELLAGLFSIAAPAPLYDKGIDQRPYSDDEYKPTEIFHRIGYKSAGMWAEL